MLYLRSTFRKHLLSGISLLAFTCSLSLASCRKEAQEARCNCTLLQDGLQSSNLEMVKTELDKLTGDLQPAPTPADEYGQQDNLFILAERIRKQCPVTAEVLHYNGIETLPPQSELKLSPSGIAGATSRIVDIGYTDQHMLTCTGMHD